MKPTRHIVADVETTDIQPSSVILTTGLIAVEISDTELTVLSRWHRRLRWGAYAGEEQQPGRTTGADVMRWWGEQKPRVFYEAFYNENEFRQPLWLAMHSLSAWLQLNPYPIWGNGSDFDNAILQHAFEQQDLRWPFWRNRCLRTLRGVVAELNPELKLPEWPEHLTKHFAIDDAEYEAHVLAVLLREMARPLATIISINVPEFQVPHGSTLPDFLNMTAAARNALRHHQTIYYSTPGHHSYWLESNLAAYEEVEKHSSALRLATLGRAYDEYL